MATKKQKNGTSTNAAKTGGATERRRPQKEEGRKRKTDVGETEAPPAPHTITAQGEDSKRPVPRRGRGRAAANVVDTAQTAAAPPATSPLVVVDAGRRAPRVDPRLPAPGTVLTKRDRNGQVRAECTVEEAGFRYAGSLYGSLSGAAKAAARDLALKGNQNGFLFWSLIRPMRVGENPMELLEKSWLRYAALAKSLLATTPEDSRRDVLGALERHREAFPSVA